MRYFTKTGIITRIALLAAAHITTPAAAASFDGQWNVQIASTSSVCRSGASVAIGINNGRGADAGGIQVTPVGSGHLVGATSGSGTWTTQPIQPSFARYPTLALYSASVTCSIHVT